MTIWFPDVSQFVASVRLGSTVACIARATEGDWLTDSSFAGFRSQAGSRPFLPYHFLETRSSAAAQAAYHRKVAGARKTMLDIEPIGTGTIGVHEPAGHTLGCGLRHGLNAVNPEAYISAPTVQGAAAFADEYAKLGGRVVLGYLPEWYWQALGRPSLEPLISRGIKLVSSAYTTYSDSGPGWASYGGMTPVIWQYTDAFPFGGGSVDFNAYKGTVSELAALFTGPAPAPSPPPPAPTPTPNPPLEEDMPAGDDLIPGVRATATWAAGSVGQIVLACDWEGKLTAAPQVRVRIRHETGNTWFDAGLHTVDGSYTYTIGTKSDVNACSLEVQPYTPAAAGDVVTVGFHTNA